MTRFKKWQLGLAVSAAVIAAPFVSAPQKLSSNILPLDIFPLDNAVQAQTTNWATVEQNLIAEHNRVRQNPQSYIPILEARLASMNRQGNIPNGCGRNCTLMTNEGKPAVEEAIRFLRDQQAVGALTASDGVAQAAKAHATDQRNGALGHTGSDGSRPSDRLTRFGVTNVGTGENIAYGPSSAQDIMVNLIVDDGVADRGHRTNIFRPSWATAGAGCGPHEAYRVVCVINYADAPRGSAASDRQFRVVNNGSVELRSLIVSGNSVLDSPLAVGQSKNVPLSNGCKANLTLQLGGNYRPLVWSDLDLCAATLTIDGQNRFKVQY